jgi:tyrosyl-tRNA synthetase
VQSTSEARRAIQQGGVRLNGEVQSDPRFLLTPPPAPVLIQVGKKRAARLLPPEG